MSSIIKGGRIRKETPINLSERLHPTNVEYDDTPKNSNDEVIDEVVSRAKEEIEFMHKTAEIVLQKANQEAKEIIAKAAKDAAKMRAEAEAECYDITQNTRKDQESLLEQTEKECQAMLEDARSEKQQIINSIEGEMVDTLKILLQYLIGEELYNNTQWLACTIRKMLSTEALKSDIKILISPNIYSRLSKKEIEMIESCKEEVTLHTSDTMSDTACRVESKEGSIEYDVKEGLERVISDIKILQNLKQESL